MKKSLHSINLADRDTLPPTCNPPYICDGLEVLITDVGVMRSQMDRIEANQELMLNEIRKLSLMFSILKG